MARLKNLVYFLVIQFPSKINEMKNGANIQDKHFFVFTIFFFFTYALFKVRFCILLGLASVFLSGRVEFAFAILIFFIKNRIFFILFNANKNF